VPAIIHKLSLEWAMRNQADECLSPASLNNTEQQLDQILQQSANSSYSLEMEPNGPLRPIMAEKNLVRLAELNNAQTTLSPFTPSIPNSVFRSSTSLFSQLHSSRHSRRRDWPSIKSSESDPNFQHPPAYVSPPESVHSAQSVDASSGSTRPSLYHSRQRSSYLRRSLQPKRKVVHLHPKSSASETASNADSGTSDDYFSEPGGYRYPDYTWDHSGSHNLHRSKLLETPIREEIWPGKGKGSFSIEGNSLSASSHFTASSHLSGNTIVANSAGEEERFLPSHLTEGIAA